MWDWIDDFNIKAWMIIGSASEDFEDDEKQQREIEKDFYDDDLDQDEDYS